MKDCQLGDGVLTSEGNLILSTSLIKKLNLMEGDSLIFKITNSGEIRVEIKKEKHN